MDLAVSEPRPQRGWGITQHFPAPRLSAQRIFNLQSLSLFALTFFLFSHPEPPVTSSRPVALCYLEHPNQLISSAEILLTPLGRILIVTRRDATVRLRHDKGSCGILKEGLIASSRRLVLPCTVKLRC